MKHLDLFSGIGGFAYAADQVWDDVEHIFCDNDKFCQQVLKKHWPEATIYDDIKTITYTERIGLQGHEPQETEGQNRVGGGKRFLQAPLILTGGFPCQPFSQAGARRGTADERHLWPEMLRVIRLTKPTWVIAENVRGLLTWNDGMVFEQVCTDLEASGYEVQPFIIPAVAVNAPHRRDRVWFVAKYASSNGRDQTQGATSKIREQRLQQDRQLERRLKRPYSTSANPGRQYGKSGIYNELQPTQAKRSAEAEEIKRFDTASWNQDWAEVATRTCGVDDGLPRRVDRLKSLGNAIVPQVAIEIMKGMVLL